MSDADPTGTPARELTPAAAPSARSPGHGHGHGHGHGGHDVGLGVLTAVGLGGLLGTLGRYEVGRAWPAGPRGFPAATFTINTSGAFLLGLALTVIVGRLAHTRYLRPFVATGLLGGWTTYSTLAVEATTLAKGGSVAVAAAYLVATVVAGLTAAWTGMALGRRGAPAVRAPIDPDLPEGSEVDP